MSMIEVVEAGPDSITLRHTETGHVFTYPVAAGDLLPARIMEGPGPKDPGDVAADVHAIAKREARSRGLI